jgi:hypothetical protein
MVTCPDIASPICRCHRIGQEERLLTIGPITIVGRKYGPHQPGCPSHVYNEGVAVQRRVSLQLVENRHSRNALLMRFAAVTSSFLAGVICMTRFIDDAYKKTAPGFKHISHAEIEIRSALGIHDRPRKWRPYQDRVAKKQLQRCQSALLQLHASLTEDFRRSRDWTHIQTWSGETLLHVSLYYRQLSPTPSKLRHEGICWNSIGPLDCSRRGQGHD